MRKEGIEQRFPSLESLCSINRDYDKRSIVRTFSSEHVIVGKAHEPAPSGFSKTDGKMKETSWSEPISVFY